MTRTGGTAFILFLLLWPVWAVGQRLRGELRLEVRDPQGSLLPSDAELMSEANSFHRAFSVRPDVQCVVQDLPFGVYRLQVISTGFSPSNKLIQIDSEVPVTLTVTLNVAPIVSEVEVTDAATLVDPNQVGIAYAIGQRRVEEQLSAQPGRGVGDLVDEEPGWLQEANGVLHPRGSEYDVQYVIDGHPITANRSPAFAPPLDADEVESFRVLTSNFPAEYGRKLGGIVEVTTDKNLPSGLRGQLDVAGGSFSSLAGSAGIFFNSGRNRFSLSTDGFHTDRYLDPPVLDNFTNRSNTDGFSGSYERDLSDRSRLRLTFSHNEVRFLIPNELVQEQAGQRQHASNRETDGEAFLQHTISPNVLLSVIASLSDSSASLNSNPLSTPIIVFQDRGYREGYFRTDVAVHHGHHDWKAGIDSVFSLIQEAVSYAITDSTQFDAGTQQNFQFADRKWDIEPSAYVQDSIHAKNWNVSAGLRFDHYALAINQSAWSPRLGVSRFISSLDVLLHASYDRIFQTPAVENLLLASSPQLQAANPVVVRLPVEPAHGDFFEVGVTKPFVGKLRLDANVFRRNFTNYSDDDTLLDTGISFPIAFASARIIGEELRLEVPHWGRFSGYLSYANQSGLAEGPITGGLFLGADASASNLTSTAKFAVSQDQRNTARARLRLQAVNRMWFAGGGQYGSGLPADIGDQSPDFLLTQYGSQILSHVNLDRGRVRPNLSLDFDGGWQLYKKERRSAELQLRVANLADRLNIVNFASLFSGTAIAQPRSASARLRFAF